MQEAKAKKSKHIFLFLRIAVVVCGIIWAIFWVSREQRWSNLAKIFLQMNMGIFAVALGIFALCQIIVGLRWWLLLRSQSIFIEFWAAVRLHFLGLFYNNFMPSSLGGDFIRAWYVTKHTDKRFEAALSVFVDRGIGLLSTLIIAGFFYSLFLRGRGSVITPTSSNQGGFLKLIAEHKQIILWVVVVIAAVFSALLLHRRGREILGKAWSYICVHGAGMIKKFTNAVTIYCSKPLTILTVFGLTVFVQIIVITSFWLLGVNLGIDASLKYYYVFFTLTWVFGALPISIGGAVVVEVLLASLFIKFAGVGEEPASALALCQRAVWMLASLPGAVIHLFGAHLPGDPKRDINAFGKPP
ncbi:MAG: lysylphosphatidylglycerol synthase transmembrane domain-containing protein [Planctomycetota bacterium]